VRRLFARCGAIADAINSCSKWSFELVADMVTRNTKDVSALEAKTHLARLLRETAKGRSFLILRRGRPVARLVPPEVGRQAKPADVLEAFQRIRRGVRGSVRVRELVEEGRRF
jgi:prevent-host-death family protein